MFLDERISRLEPFREAHDSVLVQFYIHNDTELSDCVCPLNVGMSL